MYVNFYKKPPEEIERVTIEFTCIDNVGNQTVNDYNFDVYPPIYQIYEYGILVRVIGHGEIVKFQ